MLTSGQVGKLLSHNRHTVLDVARSGQIPFTLDRYGRAAYEELDVLDYILNLYKTPPLDNWGAWFSGLVDGEGHFGIAKHTQNNGYVPLFQVGLRIEEEPVIREIHQQMKCGDVYVVPKTYKNKYGQNIAPKVIYNIRKFSDCIKLTDLLDAYPLRTNKKEDYTIWKMFIEYKRHMRHHKFTEDEIATMDQMYHALKQCRIDRKIQ
jgi:hypothetical protein